MQKESADVLDLIEQAKSGNELAFELLLKRYYPLIKSISKRFYLLGFDEDDYYQEASMAFFKAITTFNGQQPFSAFAKTCIHNRLTDIYRREKSSKNKILSEYVSLESDFKESTYFNRDLSDFTNLVLDNLSFVKTLSSFFASLSPLEAKVFLYILSGKNYIEIAVLIGKSPKSIDNAIQRIKQKLCSFLQEHGS